MAVKAKLLNKTVVVERASTTLDDSGDSTGSRTQIEAALKGRIVRNRLFGQSSANQAGPITSSTHKLITNGAHGGQEGDLVVDGSDEYIVSFIDKKPGGTIVGEKLHHWEVFMNASTAERT